MLERQKDLELQMLCTAVFFIIRYYFINAILVKYNKDYFTDNNLCVLCCRIFVQLRKWCIKEAGLNYKPDNSQDAHPAKSGPKRKNKRQKLNK